MTKIQRTYVLNSKWKWSLCLAVLVCLMLLPVAYADFYLEWEHITNSVAGQPDKTKIIRTYYTCDAFRVDIDEEVVIMDFDSMIMYQLNTKDRSYTKSNIGEVDLMPRSASEGAQVFQRMLMNVTGLTQVTPTSETKKIGGYLCRKHNVTIMTVNAGEYWLSKDVGGYKELSRIQNKAANMLHKSPMLNHMNITGAMQKSDGFPVRIVVRMMGGITTTSLRSLEKKLLSKNLFKVPSGYRLSNSDYAGCHK